MNNLDLDALIGKNVGKLGDEISDFVFSGVSEIPTSLNFLNELKNRTINCVTRTSPLWDLIRDQSV